MEVQVINLFCLNINLLTSAQPTYTVYFWNFDEGESCIVPQPTVLLCEKILKYVSNVRISESGH